MRALSIFSGLFLSLLVTSTNAEPAITYFEGKDYIALSEPLRTVDPSKIEVTEAFAYPCHFCFNFEPMLERWVKAQSTDVVFIRTHVAFREEWIPYQRGYYTVLALNLKDMDMNIFNEVNVKHNELNTAEAWASFLSGYGVDKQTVIKTYDSFAVTSRMAQAEARNRGFKISGTPTLIVDGKYKVINGSNGNEEMLKVAQFLVDKIRAEKK